MGSYSIWQEEMMQGLAASKPTYQQPTIDTLTYKQGSFDTMSYFMNWLNTLDTKMIDKSVVYRQLMMTMPDDIYGRMRVGPK